MDKPKSIYICIPMSVFYERFYSIMAHYWTSYFESRGYMAINPFDLRDQLEKCYHVLSERDPMAEDYRKERNTNIAFCDTMFLCKGWADDAECMNDVYEGIKHGVKFILERGV